MRRRRARVDLHWRRDVHIARPGGGERGTNAMRLEERTLQLLERGGVRGPVAVEAMRALVVYTLGSAAVEVPQATDPESASS
ncbi:MAG TPA: TetR/AcrR family transcriptional regulator C-terminal domain-containing protein [Gemmatimonadaceae bacterium]|nr:TetR/AcrR family transcriptional regulator C-terminal domain-containing protein [Gemmatimonadaceae bacterium]